ncbi:hypothetical protein COX84_06110, partial [Candidatus Micrarchaeota archaeon CG_4_10_14_0_2_um_filter_49_7]
MTRDDAPKSLRIKVSDADWGDSVEVTKVRVVDSTIPNNLKSCVTIKTLGGGILDGTVLRPGQGNAPGVVPIAPVDPAAMTKITEFIIDPRDSHGIFDKVGNRSECSGSLVVEIRDVGNGGNDTTGFASCKVSITVTNGPPHLVEVKLLDMEKVQGKSPLTREGSNMIDGRGKLFVGSVLTLEN